MQTGDRRQSNISSLVVEWSYDGDDDSDSDGGHVMV